jgi:hypothetical protein
MVPMLDPMVPEATLLFTISPAFAGVMLALVAAVAASIAGAARELPRRERRPPAPTPAARPRESSPLAA